MALSRHWSAKSQQYYWARIPRALSIQSVDSGLPRQQPYEVGKGLKNQEEFNTMKPNTLITGKCFQRNLHLIPQSLRRYQTGLVADNPLIGGNTVHPGALIRVMMVLVICLALSPLALGGTFTVTNTLDSGPGSLRHAIEDASLNMESDLIEFDPLLAGQTISLNESLIIADDDLTFDGSRASGLMISASFNSRVLEVKTSAIVEIVQLTLADGDASSEPTNIGGGVLNMGTLFITTSTITNSTANIGGGIYNDAGTATITHSTITNNTAATAPSGFRGGGAVANHSGVVTIENSTISGNRAGSSTVLSNNAFGGGVFNRGNVGTVMVINSTVSGNEASDDGAGLYNHTGDNMMVISGTVTDNASASEGGGIDNFGTIEIQNTILAGNTAGVSAVSNCRSLFGGSITSKGHSLIGPGCSFNGPTGTDLVLGQGSLEGLTISDVLDPTLAANGGPTYSHALVTEAPDFEVDNLALEVGNPAIDAGSCGGIDGKGVDIDQRSLDRAFDHPTLPNTDDGCDIGAFEVTTESCLSKQAGDWDDGATWNCGFRPTLLDDVVVAPGHQVRIVDDEEVKTLKIAAGKGRDLQGGGNLIAGSNTINVHENLIIDGRMDPGTGTIEMKGISKQTIKGEGLKTFYRLHISNEAATPGDSADVETEGPVEVLDETRVKQGQFRPDDESRFQDLTVDSQGRIKPELAASIEVKGNLTSETSGALVHNDGTIRFTGTERQTVTGSVAFKNVEVEKITTDDDLKALELAPGTKVEGETRIMQGQLTPATATTFQQIVIEPQGTLKPQPAARVELRGDLARMAGGTFAHNQSTMRFTGSERQTVTGAVVFKEVEVEKVTADDNLKALELASGTKVEGVTRIMKGQLAPASATTFEGIAIEGQGTFKPASAATIEIKGNLISATPIALAHNESTLRFTGAEQQTVTGGVTLKNLEVEKSSDPSRDLVLNPGTTVEGDTKIMKGRLTPATTTTFRKIAIEPQGTLKPQPAARVELRGDLIRMDGGTFENNESTIRFTGAEQQTVTGGVTFNNLEVEKPTDFTKDLVLDPGITIEGDTRVLGGQIAPATGTTFLNVHILALAAMRQRRASDIAIQGDFILENGGHFDGNEGSVLFSGASGEQNAIFEGGTTTMNVNLINPDGLHARYAEGTAGTTTLKVCDSSVILDSIDTGDEVFVQCGSIRTQVVDGPIHVALGVAERVRMTIPDETRVTATPVEGEVFEIENSADSHGSLVASVDGVELDIRPGEVAETTAEGALGLLRQDILDLGLQKGIQNSLVKKVDSALKKLAKNQIKTTMNKVNAFIHQVQALSGKKFSTESGDALVAAAQGVLLLLSMS